MSETLETLKAYCSENNRAVPMPTYWNECYQMLNNKSRKASGGWEPSLPLILGAWHDTIPLMKVLRFNEHLQWAEKEGQLDDIGRYLRSLTEDQWAHYGELPT